MPFSAFFAELLFYSLVGSDQHGANGAVIVFEGAPFNSVKIAWFRDCKIVDCFKLHY